jgi:hypothetical protein
MKGIAIVDTTIICELLEVPGKSDPQIDMAQELRSKIEQEEALFLPLAAILETGNHIGQLPGGAQRRACAKGLMTLVTTALDGKSPFVPLAFWEKKILAGWIPEFPDWAASAGSGFGDFTIKKDWESQCELNPGRRVYIWSLDNHLAAYDRGPVL